MKTLSLLTLSIILFAFTAPVEKFTVDTNRSKIEWTGRKVTGFHTGEIKLASGYLMADKKQITAGLFELDMNSITTTDLQGSSATKLLGHLKSDDFFSVENNPRSQFAITKITPQTPEKLLITGTLTIKGIANPITFPATVKQKHNVIVATANSVQIDRTKYNIKYGSKSFIAGLGDKAIDDNFELNIQIVAKK